MNTPGANNMKSTAKGAMNRTSVGKRTAPMESPMECKKKIAAILSTAAAGLLLSSTVSAAVLVVDATTTAVTTTETYMGVYQTSPGIHVVNSGTLNIQSGADVTVAAVGPNNSNQTWVRLGSQLNISGGAINFNNRIWVDAGSAINVIGDTATITGHQIDGWWTGTMGFSLNETGVSSIVLDSWSNLNAVDLVVDGSDYTGGSADFLLINSGSAFETTSISGFDSAEYNAEMVLNDDNFHALRVTAISVPEPSSIGLLGLGATLLCLKRRRMA